MFDYGRLTNQVLVQDARFQQLYEQYQDAVLRAAREVDDAAVGFAKSRVQIALLAEAVQAARRSLDIATIQYREGLVDFQRVLDSQRTLFSQQERLVNNRGDVTQNLIALYKAMGGGWQPGRGRPVLDDATRETMGERSDWKNCWRPRCRRPAPKLQQPLRGTDDDHEPGTRKAGDPAPDATTSATRSEPGRGTPHRRHHRARR